MRAAFFGAFQPTHLQITRGGWRLASKTSHSPSPSPLASKNRRSMQPITLDVQFEAKTDPKTGACSSHVRHCLPEAKLAIGGAVRLYSTILAGLAAACSTGLAVLRAMATYISPSFDISDM